MRYLQVEEARKKLGRLVEAAAGGEPVVIGRRGAQRAVLVSGEEYERLRRVEEEAARLRLREALDAIAGQVRRARLPLEVVDEALRSVRRR